MRAVRLSEHGGTEVLETTETDRPEPGGHELLVEVAAAGVNPVDTYFRDGSYTPAELPFTPGVDVAGTVAAVGEFVDGFEVGDRVFGTGIGNGTFQGAYAEYATVPEDRVVHLPDGADLTEAGGAGVVAGTAWRALVDHAALDPAEYCLIHGGSGGVGHAAVQIADHVGAEVYATASSDEKLDYARDIGADHTINYETEEFDAAIKEATGNRGVDVVVDHIGAETWQQSLRSLARGGRLVTCGATTGPHPETDINRIFWNQLEVIGSTMGTPGEVDDVLGLVWDGTFEPRIREVLPMSETARGHELLEEREGFGKVVLKPDSAYNE